MHESNRSQFQISNFEFEVQNPVPLRPLRGFALRPFRFLFGVAVKDEIPEKENHPVSRGGCHPSFVRRGALAPPFTTHHLHFFKDQQPTQSYPTSRSHLKHKVHRMYQTAQNARFAQFARSAEMRPFASYLFIFTYFGMPRDEKIASRCVPLSL